MSFKDKIINYYKTEGKSEIAQKLLEMAETVATKNTYKCSDFLDPYSIGIAETVKAHYENALFMEVFGGYEGCERARVIFANNDFAKINNLRENLKEETIALALQWNEKYAINNIAHRDVLGAVLNCGVKRELIGDILINNGIYQAVIIAKKESKSILEQYLLKVSNINVILSEIDFDKIQPKEEKTKEIKTTVASMRLDSIAASGYGLSRTKMAEEISGGRLKLNWKETTNVAMLLKEGDVMSIRGKGRVCLEKITGNTKKGRIGILLKRYY